MPFESLVPDSRRTALHWYDFTCPFCYVGQARDARLRARGVEVVDRGMQAHPEIPDGGIAMGPRAGPMYAFLEAEAAAAGLPIRWPPRLPNSRLALSAAEWVRLNAPEAFPALSRALFAAHFAEGRDIGERVVVKDAAANCGVDGGALSAALDGGEAARLLLDSEAEARAAGVTGTPAWLIGGRLVSGLQPAEVFERLASA